MLVTSSNGSNTYQLTPIAHQCEYNCPAHQSLSAGFAENAKMTLLLVDHQTLKGQLPDKYVFSLWATWKANSFESYQVQQQQWERRQGLSQRHKEMLKRQGISLRQDIPGVVLQKLFKDRAFGSISGYVKYQRTQRKMIFAS